MPMRGQTAISSEYVEQLRHQLGLDKPLPHRYVIWVREVLRGNLGTSNTTRKPVLREIKDRLPATLELMGVSTLFAILLGVPLGVVSALKQYSIVDYILMGLSFAWVCIPDFFFGLLTIYFFALRLKVLPSGGFRTPGAEFSLADNFQHLLLPVLVLGMANMATFMRYTRASVLDVVHKEYITVARAKGLAERAITYRHALRNALIPVVTRIGLNVAWLFSGALIVEAVFRWPGLGSFFMQAIVNRDYPMITGMNLFIAVTTLLANLLTDIAYAFVDPRIKYE
jgi:peptide/nickel transport system permease protein